MESVTHIQTIAGIVTIRSVRESDAAACRDLRVRALCGEPTAFSADLESTEARPLTEWQEQMRGGDGAGDTLYCIAEADGLLGMMIVKQDFSAKTRHQANIFGVYVLPDWRRKGVFHALFMEGLRWAEQKQIRMLKLSVAAHNAAAVHAYTRLGFQIYGVDPQALLWNDVFHDELLMYRWVTEGKQP